MAADVAPIVLYGGTFDPVHNGHLAVACAARDALAAEVRLLPAADPPHRAAPGADAATRVLLLEAAVGDEPGLRVDRSELERGGRSYSADTLDGWRRRAGPRTPLVWLLGADAFLGLPAWHRWPELLDLAHWVYVDRPGHALAGLDPTLARELRAREVANAATLRAAPAGAIWRLELPLRDESATKVREAIATDAPGWEALVPAAVAARIRAGGFYRARR